MVCECSHFLFFVCVVFFFCLHVFCSSICLFVCSLCLFACWCVFSLVCVYVCMCTYMCDNDFVCEYDFVCAYVLRALCVIAIASVTALQTRSLDWDPISLDWILAVGEDESCRVFNTMQTEEEALHSFQDGSGEKQLHGSWNNHRPLQFQSCQQDGSVALWDLRESQPTKKFTMHNGTCGMRLARNPYHEDLVAVAGFDSSLYMYDTRNTHTPVAFVPGAHDSLVTDLKVFTLPPHPPLLTFLSLASVFPPYPAIPTSYEEMEMQCHHPLNTMEMYLHHSGVPIVIEFWPPAPPIARYCCGT